MESESEIIKVPSAPGSSTPLTDSYTYHAPTPTAEGPYILGVDEAGRGQFSLYFQQINSGSNSLTLIGPVLGPLVYGVAYCPAAYRDNELEELGFAGMPIQHICLLHLDL